MCRKLRERPTGRNPELLDLDLRGSSLRLRNLPQSIAVEFRSNGTSKRITKFSIVPRWPWIYMSCLSLKSCSIVDSKTLVYPLLFCFKLGPFGPLRPLQDRRGNWTLPRAKTKVGEPPMKRSPNRPRCLSTRASRSALSGTHRLTQLTGEAYPAAETELASEREGRRRASPHWPGHVAVTVSELRREASEAHCRGTDAAGGAAFVMVA